MSKSRLKPTIDGKTPCSMCREWYPATEKYFKPGNTRAGLRSECRECSRKRNKTDRRRNIHRHSIDELGRKQCGRCEKWLTLDKYGLDRTRKGGRSRLCKECKATERKTYSPSGHRNNHLRRSYGLSIEQFNAMVEKQHGRCGICGEVPTEGWRRALAVDHCHSSGKVRALLCQPCNMGLGAFKDRCDLLESAIEYLKRHSTRQNCAPR